MVDDGDPGRWAAIRAGLARRFGIDARALAAYRIAAAALVLADLLIYRLPDLGAFYTDAGVLPRSVLAGVFPVASTISLHTVTGTLIGQAVLVAGLALAALALLVGYRTRLAAAITWVLLASMQARNPHVLNAGDTLLLATLFFGLFLPLGRRWSLDVLRVPASDRQGRLDVVVNPATVGLLLQIVVVYATNAVFKARSPRWMDGTAVRRIFALDDFTVRLGDLLAQAPELLVAANWVWFAAVAASPLLVLLTGWPRAGFAAFLASLHLGMLATLMLGLFPLVSIAALLLVLPPVVWDHLESQVGQAPRTVAQAIPTWMRPRPRGRGWIPAEVRTRSRELVHGALVVLILLGGVWHAMAMGFVTKPEAIEEAGRAAEHEWRMFAPASTTYGWVAAPANLTTGEQVDAIGLTSYDPAPPPDLADAYPSTLWHRYLKDLPEVTDAEQAALATFLCHRTAETYDATVESVELIYVEHEVRLDEPDPETRHVLHRQSCPSA